VTQPSTVLPMLNEKDPQALALGYVEDGNKADKSKFPMSVATSQCSNCALYSGKPSESSGPCTIFPGKNVMAAGWCNSWAKKA
jgi:High potential iron-sulfur protein